jgi:uncharacterized heparinase superfamily protein
MAFGELKNKLQNIAYGTRVYQSMLRGGRGYGPAAELLVVPADMWPAQAALGQHYLTYDFGLGVPGGADEPSLLVDTRQATPLDMRVHDFSWLRDLRVLGGDEARRRARQLITAWLDRFANWDEVAWALPPLGARVANALAMHDFYAASADDAFRARLFETLSSHVRHLGLALPANVQGYAFVQAMKGLIFGSVCLPSLDSYFEKAVALFLGRLDSLLGQDGFCRERSPRIQLLMLRDLIDIRNLLSQSDVAVPQALTAAIDQMAPALRFISHGDGGLALFHGSDEGLPVLIEAVLTQTGTRARKRVALPDSGYEKIQSNRSLLLVDAGLPPPAGFDTTAHAGLAAFEFSSGRERIIVNCGALDRPTPAWRQALAATAAHSTLTVQDTNAVEVMNEGVGARPSMFEVERDDHDGFSRLIITHNAYAPIAQLVHRRMLQLSKDGLTLHGEEQLRGALGASFAIRFHLHPAVQVSLIQDGRAALLKLPSGQGWRLKCQPHVLALMPSIYAGDARLGANMATQGGGMVQVRPTKQLVIEGKMSQDVVDLAWSLIREG